MKWLMVALVVAVAATAQTQETYNKKYDNFNGQELAENRRLLKAYANCLLDKGPCTAEGADINSVIPDALENSCARCTPKQKAWVRIVVKALQKQLPQVWQELAMKKDPQAKYKETFDRFLAGNN